MSNKITKKKLLKVIREEVDKELKEVFPVSEPKDREEMLSGEHHMMTILTRKIYSNLDNKEAFFKNLDLIEKSLSRASSIQGDLSKKFFTLETILGNLQRIYEYEVEPIDVEAEPAYTDEEEVPEVDVGDLDEPLFQ